MGGLFCISKNLETITCTVQYQHLHARFNAVLAFVKIRGLIPLRSNAKSEPLVNCLNGCHKLWAHISLQQLWTAESVVPTLVTFWTVSCLCERRKQEAEGVLASYTLRLSLEKLLCASKLSLEESDQSWKHIEAYKSIETLCWSRRLGSSAPETHSKLREIHLKIASLVSLKSPLLPHSAQKLLEGFSAETLKVHSRRSFQQRLQQKYPASKYSLMLLFLPKAVTLTRFHNGTRARAHKVNVTV
ncbi:uncharacterized protein LOC112149403 [Oryzias melastigma]|uniref:uncharacterized protein LOC112149403 n=1 Tax=Oryzias melastigma TaxID=30732 RepID=UPI000CF7C7B2|nr:uncharacterized protein LOC112149403 [Oryzias melastigma]